MSIDSIVTIGSAFTFSAGSIIGIYVFLRSSIVRLETELKHLKSELEREREERVRQMDRIEEFHEKQMKAWHDVRVSIEGLNKITEFLQNSQQKKQRVGSA
jgi:hypothetical protein